MTVYTGVGGVVKTVNELRTGVGGVVKTCNDGHIGIAGVNRPFFQYKLTDLDHILFKINYLRIYQMTANSDNTYTYTVLGSIPATKYYPPGFLVSDILKLTTHTAWTLGYNNTTNSGSPSWRINGSSTTYIIPANVAITTVGNNVDFTFDGYVYAVLTNGQQVMLNTFLINSNVTSVNATICVYTGGSGNYAGSQSSYALGYTFFPNGVPYNGGRDTHTYTLANITQASNSWGLGLGSAYGQMVTNLYVNDAFSSYGSAWTFTDSDMRMVTFDKSRILVGFE